MLFKKKRDVVEEIKKNQLIGPEKVMISPTDACNLRCKTCWRLEKPDYKRLKEELTLEEIKRILKECKKLKVKTIDLTGGGEPFYRKDIFEIIKLAKKYGFETTLTTNGTLLDEERIKKILSSGLDDICFSIESGEEKINDKLRGKGTYKKILEAIKKINELKKHSKKPTTRIATVLTKKNYKRLDSLIEFALKNRISAINFSPLIEWKTNKPLSMKKERKSLDVLRKLNEKIEKKELYSNLKLILKHGLFEHEPPKFCFAPWEMLFINSNGKVLACCTLASHYESIMGNIREESLSQIWYGKKMNKFRERIKTKEYFDECKKCLPEFTERYNQLHERLKNE